MSVHLKTDISSIIGNRVKSIRALTGLSREEFEKKYCISSATLRAWEDPQNNRGGLTKKGALRLLATLKQSGIYCTLDWLFYGTGSGPKTFDNFKDKRIEFVHKELLVPDIHYSKELAVLNDVHAFQKNNPAAQVLIVDNEGMCPFYWIGDYVGGIPVQDDQIKLLIGENCIVETEAGDMLIRRLLHGSSDGVYTLICTNLDAKNIDLVISNIKLRQAAKIIWYRKSI